MQTEAIERFDSVSSLEPARLSPGQLRDLAVRADSASGTVRDPADAALAWKALVEGRLAVVDQFDAQGRRYVVVRRHRALRSRLTSREREVLRYAASGHAGKHIAYELGISQSTVALHLKSAARKLGFRSRVELVLAVAVARGSTYCRASPPR